MVIIRPGIASQTCKLTTQAIYKSFWLCIQDDRFIRDESKKIIVAVEWCRWIQWGRGPREAAAQALPEVMWDPGVEFIASFQESSSMLASPDTVLNLLKRSVACLDLCHRQLPCRPSRRSSDPTTRVLSWELYSCAYSTKTLTFQLSKQLLLPHTTSHPRSPFFHSQYQ